MTPPTPTSRQTAVFQPLRFPCYPPQRNHATDAGLDIRAAESVTLYPGQPVRVATNLRVALPEGTFGMISPRSGLAAKRVKPYLAPGIVDCGYRGELWILMVNDNPEPFQIQEGDRICQMVVLATQIVDVEMIETSAELPPSERGEKGWGSSGVK